MLVRYKLLGQYCNPVNRENIYIEVNHDQQSVINQPKPHVGINNLYFSREDILKIMNVLNSSPGITEGVPFNIEFTEQGITEVLTMYINLMDGLKRSNDGIMCAVKMLQSLDWLDERVDGFTLESMYNETSVIPFQIDGIPYNSYQDFFDKRCIYIPYVLSTIPNYQDVFTAFLSATYVLVELSRAIKTVIQWANPMEGFGIVIGAVQLAAEIVFTLLLLAALAALILHLFNCLIQAIKYHGAMLMTDMLKICAQKIGLKLNSSIYEAYPFNCIAYLPEKFNPIEDATPSTLSIMGEIFQGFKPRGFTTPGYATSAVHDSSTTTIQKGYYNGTGGDFMRLAKKLINGKIIIPDGTNKLVLERRDFFPAGTPFQLPDIRQDWNGYNTDELTANIIIRFADDLNDKNSINYIDTSGNTFYPGTILQATHSQVTTVNDLLVCLKGLREIKIEAARGVRKQTLNFIEQMQLDLSNFFEANQVAGLIAINAAIVVANVVIVLIDYYIVIWNALMDIVSTIVTVINTLVNTLNDVINNVNSLIPGGGNIPNVNGVGTFNGLYLPTVNFIPFMTAVPFAMTFPSRLDTLLLENDMVTTPKLLMVDINRREFTDAGGFSGKKRIAYLNKDNGTFNNTKVVNAQFLWDNFYKIDAFVGSTNNRRTKISPALNKPDEKNPFLMRLKDFKNLVSNPKLLDNFGEEVESDSIQWYIEKNGATNIDFRKKGWLRAPQSNDGMTRAQEINLNLQIKTSLPNGQ